MEELQKIRNMVNLPIVVIGGITKANASIFHSAGIDGMAIVSAIIAQPDIRKAATEIKDLFCGEGLQHGI
jgi:thiamine-phosphate pyrophosphorylase